MCPPLKEEENNVEYITIKETNKLLLIVTKDYFSMFLVASSG